MARWRPATVSNPLKSRRAAEHGSGCSAWLRCSDLARVSNGVTLGRGANGSGRGPVRVVVLTGDGGGAGGGARRHPAGARGGDPGPAGRRWFHAPIILAYRLMRRCLPMMQKNG